MLYNNPHTRPTCCYPQGRGRPQTVLLPRAVVAVSLQGEPYIRVLHLRLKSVWCATRKPFSLLHALSGPRHAAGSAEWPIALLLPACSGGRMGCRHHCRFALAT